jgi:hypothetical protein
MYDRPLRIDTARTKKRIKTKHMFLFFPPMKSNVRILCRCLEQKNVVVLHRRKKNSVTSFRNFLVFFLSIF